METTAKTNAKNAINHKIAEIIKLYSTSTIVVLLNDLAAIGTWPTPEQPATFKGAVKTGGGSVAIDTVPLPERIKKLKGLLSGLVRVAGTRKVNRMIKTI